MDTLSKTGEENSIDQINCQKQTCPKKFRKTSSSSNDYIESLPVDVTIEILVRVPAQDIHNSARLVCRRWRKIISTRDFKHAHLHRSTCGLLVHDQSLSSRHELTFIATGSKADLIEISKKNYRSQHEVVSSCNGLVLAARNITRYLYITNPSTVQNLDLPPFFSNNRLAYGSAIAYVATTMEYKVVRAYIHQAIKRRQSPDDCVTILTVGVDKDWTRCVDTQHISRRAKKLLFMQHPLTTEGFVHWAQDEDMVCWAQYERRSGFVLTLNVETEIITQFPVPSLSLNDIGIIYTEVKYLQMGSCLSLLILRSEFSWELWEMKPETGEWIEMPSIDLEALFVSTRSYILKPVGWLRPREVLVFSVGERIKPSRFDSYYPTPFCFAFTLRTRKLQKFMMGGLENKYVVHRNSLVWINGC